MKSSGPISISIDITNRCNLKCLHCYNSSGEGDYSNEMTDKDLEKLFNEIVEIGPLNICFCGGETLIRKDIVRKYTKLLSSNNIACSIVTNGFYLTRDLLEELIEYGINNIQISLDGTELSHNRLRQHPKAYEKAVGALKLLSEYNIYSGIAFSPTAWNIDDFDHVLNIAKETNCNELRLQELMPIGRAASNNEILPSQTQYRELRKLVFEREQEYVEGKHNIKIEWGDPLEHIYFLSDQDKESESFTEAISILSDGSITPSVYLPLTFGNVKKYSLKKYWEAGLSNIWDSNIVTKLAKQFSSVQQMNDSQSMEFSDGSDYDLIENSSLLRKDMIK